MVYIEQAVKTMKDESVECAFKKMHELQREVRKSISKEDTNKHEMSIKIADVLIGLDWIVEYFGISEEDIAYMLEKKISKIERDLANGELSGL